jgi:PAS domain S-box-containing protein
MDLAVRRTPKKYLVLLVGGWTLLVLLSLFWNVHETKMQHVEKARIEARTFYELNLAYRRWASLHGGVYVPLTDTFQPNPYLQVPDRDLTATTGKKLTLVNPAWMTRQVFDLLGRQSPLPVISHLTSLKYLNPVNAPDPWEETALRTFEQGSSEVSELTTLGGEPYVRVMRPFKTEPPCLKCHGHQGYQVGAVRGAISIAVPLKPHLVAARKEQLALIVSHLFLWFIGSGGIMLFSRRIEHHQQRIFESENQYRLLFENNPQPMWVYDLESLRFLAVNDAAVSHYGYSRDEFLNMTITDIRPKEDVVRLLENVSRVTTGLDNAGVWRHRRKDGAVISVEITSHVVDFGGRRAELVLANDVTDRQRLEDQLRQAQKMEAVGLLAGGVSHDFNNVLTAIIGYGNLLQRKLPEHDPLRAYAESILTTAQRAAQLTQSLLTFSRKQVMKPMPVDLNSVIGRIGKLLRRLIREDIDIRLQLCEHDTTIMAESIQLEQVIMNLATNARDAMPDGGVLTISTTVIDRNGPAASIRGMDMTGPAVRLTISDTGIGMDERTRERVFEPFYTTKEMGKGTGLGLALVYSIISQHKGSIDVESAPGIGTSFHIYLPLVKPSLLLETKAPETKVTGGTETILVAEDDQVLLDLSRSVLEEFGYTVLAARDGEEAVRMFRENRDRVRLLLSDVIMPKKNGRATFEEVRAISPGIKVLFVSGYSTEIISKEGILDEGVDMITKPLSPVELLRKVREVLDR